MEVLKITSSLSPNLGILQYVYICWSYNNLTIYFYSSFNIL